MPADDTGFKLSEIVKAAQAETGLVDPDALAEVVFARTPREHLAEAYRACLREYVRQHTAVSSPRLPASAAGPSRAGQIRQWWQRALDGAVAGVGGEFKALRDCTRDDLLYAVARRREMAAENLAAADRFEALAGLLDEHGVKTVGELPADVLGGGLAGAA